MISLVRCAGALKRAKPDTDEGELMKGAWSLTVAPKLTEADTVLFEEKTGTVGRSKDVDFWVSRLSGSEASGVQAAKGDDRLKCALAQVLCTAKVCHALACLATSADANGALMSCLEGCGVKTAVVEVTRGAIWILRLHHQGVEGWDLHCSHARGHASVRSEVFFFWLERPVRSGWRT
mmetsp:Transcript_176393/g.560282  ORF Transcript_176393/g.560282 Transcript_176393/m.560282 type:complete len:178 (-) Transcript_176393:309-842(-)